MISSSVPESWCSFASLPGSRRGPLFELPLASSQAGPAVIYTVAPSPPLSRLDLQPTSQIQPARLLLSPDVAPSLSAVAAARQRRCVAVAPSTSPASPASAPRSVAPAPSVAAVFWPRAHPPCGGLNAGNGGADAQASGARRLPPWHFQGGTHFFSPTDAFRLFRRFLLWAHFFFTNGCFLCFSQISGFSGFSRFSTFFRETDHFPEQQTHQKLSAILTILATSVKGRAQSAGKPAGNSCFVSVFQRTID